MSADKMILDSVTNAIKRYKNDNADGYKIHPLDDEIAGILQTILGRLDEENDYAIFRSMDDLKSLWSKLIEKSIVCLRYYDNREPFQGNEKKEPRAYGIDQLDEYFEKYSGFESMLYGGARYYRGHVVHVFRVWLLGIKILLSDKLLDKMHIDGNSHITKDEKIAIWTIIALTHDLGYPLEKALQLIDRTKDMMKSFVVNPTVSMDLSFSGVQNQMNDFVLRLISSKMIEKDQEGEKKYQARLQSKYYFKFQKSLEHNKHGVLSALIIYKMLLYFLESDYSINEDYFFKEEDARQFYIRRDILRAVASHTCSDIYQLDACSFSFLLILADDAQEWGRKSISDLYTSNKSNKYNFEKAIVNSDNPIYKCIIKDGYELADIDSATSIIERLVKQAKTYRDIFRDGQKTSLRNFDFEREVDICVIINGNKERYNYKLNIPHDKSASVEISKPDLKGTDPLFSKLHEMNKDAVSFQRGCICWNMG